MLILILIDVQYSHNVVFTFEKGSNDSNYFLSDSYHPLKKSLHKISYSPHLGDVPLLLNAI